MKKLVVLVVIVVVLGGLWWWGSTRGSLLEEAGRLAKADHCRVEVPISASGEARERQRVEIKAEASGTIMELAVNEGDIVQPNQLLLRIDEEEELRNVEKAQAAVDQAEESVEIAKIANEQAIEDNTFNVEKAQAALEAAQAVHDFAKSNYEHKKKLFDDNNAPAQEFERAQSDYFNAKAKLDGSRYDLKRATATGPRNVKRSEREISLAQARLRNAQFNLSDAQRRLRKTKVCNNYPSACRVVRIFVSEGQVVSSAVSVVGAGTPVMELADISRMEVEAQVDESDVDKVVRMMIEGQKQRESGTPTTGPSDADTPQFRDQVQVRFDALPRATFTGRIVEVAQKPRSVAQIVTYPVRVRLDDDEGIESVRLGMQGTVEFAPVSEEGLCIPYEAVHRLGRDAYVVKMPDPNDPRGPEIDREVQVGLTDGSKVILRGGLEPDEKFYVKLPTRIPRED